MQVEEVKEELKKLGCPPQAISIVLRVFVELTEVKRMLDVRPSYSHSLGLPYLIGEGDVFVPRSSGHMVTPEFVENLQQELGQRITLACVEGDSIIVFYTFSEGLPSPTSHDAFVRNKNKTNHVI